MHKDQFNRVLRWYERFKEINDGCQREAHFDYQYDDMLAFFLNCYHLKDWIKRDFELEKTHHDYMEFKQLQADVEKFISENECLSLCADLCNGAKHCSVDENRLRFPESVLVHSEVHIDESRSNKIVKRKWTIRSESGNEYDAFEIATDCVSKWSEFFASHEHQIRKLILTIEEGMTEEEYMRVETPSALKPKGGIPGSSRSVSYHVRRNC